MKTLTRDADSLSHFKRDTDRVVQKLKRTGKPLVLTVKGHAELVAAGRLGRNPVGVDDLF